jgi:hypothetical protein
LVVAVTSARGKEVIMSTLEKLIATGPFIAAAVLALGSVACQPNTTIETAVPPSDASTDNPRTVQAVRAYLHTFKLNEKDLIEGLTIPFAYGWVGDTGSIGTATATGKMGPNGHQIYRVVLAECHGCAARFLEIAPEGSM